VTAARVLADLPVRLAAGATALLVTAMAARRKRDGPDEAAAFRAVNDLPGWLYRPPGSSCIWAPSAPSWETPRTTPSTPSPGSP
jgi:hypothetical protein